MYTCTLEGVSSVANFITAYALKCNVSNVKKCCSAKATHIFSAKNISKISVKNISESTKTVNEMTLNELVKLTTLWTTGPIFLFPLGSLGPLCYL